MRHQNDQERSIANTHVKSTLLQNEFGRTESFGERISSNFK